MLRILYLLYIRYQVIRLIRTLFPLLLSPFAPFCLEGGKRKRTSGTHHPPSVYGFSIHLYYLEFYLEHKIYLYPTLNCSLVCDHARHINWFLSEISFL
jgi:hypothetical protein